MRKISLSILLFISLSVVSQGVPGIATDYIRFKTLELPKDQRWGLITAIAQDSTGFMWLATWSGLHRFDGTRFTDYNHDDLNPNSLAFERTECLFADKSRYIYVGTYGRGLDRLNPLTGVFTHFTHRKDDINSLSNDTITVLAKGTNGKLWVGTINGLNEFDPETGKCKRFLHDAGNPSSISENNIRVIYEDRQGVVWIGTKDAFNENNNPSRIGGLNRFDPATGRFTRYLSDPKNPATLIDNTITAVFEDSRGNLLVGTRGDGLHLMNREAGTFQRLPYDPKHPENLSRPALISRDPGTAPDHITFINEDKGGRIWIGTFGNGINIYDPEKKIVTHFSADENNINKLPNSEFWRAFRSKEGIMWVSAWAFNGEPLNLFQVNPFEYRLAKTELGYFPFSFLENDDGSMWIGTDSCLLKHNTDGTLELYPVKINGKTMGEKNFVSSIVRDDKGGLWITPQHGLYRFDPATKTFKGYLRDDKNPASLGADGVFLLEKEDNNKLWACTNNGLELFDIPSGTFTHFRHNVNDSNTISSNSVNGICKLKNGEIMIGLQDAADRINMSTGKITHYKMNGIVSSFVEDDNGTLWAGTQNGLFRYVEARQQFVPYTDYSGALNSSTFIFQLAVDKKKNLFIAVPAGLVKLNTQTNEISAYGEINGLLSNPNYGRYMMIKRNGELLIGNSTEYLHFNPDNSLSNLPRSMVLFSGFAVADTMIMTGTGSVLSKPIFETDKIQLRYNQNVFSILYSVIDYTERLATTPTVYMLENYDQRWRKSNSENIANYVNVEPGTYTFKVKTTNSSGVWVQKELRIIVNPPWWKTTWAYVLYGLIFIVLAFIANRIVRNRIIEKEKAKHREKELAHAKEIEKAYNELKLTQTQLIQSEKMASLGELTAGVAHEIQNPLNFVNNFSEVNNELIEELKNQKSTLNSNEQEEILNDIFQNNEKISLHGKRADSIVKNMLLHSRRSGGVKEPTDINALADEYFRLAYHGLRARDQRDAAHKSFNATMKTEMDETIGNVNIIPQDIGRVLLNLYNNAFYAVNEKSKTAGAAYVPVVTVNTKKTIDKVIISVKDNGNGIPQKIVDKIFQPFFTTKPTGQGTGLGLSLSYDIIKTHGGEITVDTKEGEGTVFTIKLPL